MSNLRPVKKLLLTACFFSCILNPTFSQDKLTAFVDPFIGTGGHGHTYPGATLPFGMVQLSPDNGSQGWDWCSGYHYSDSIIQGFSHRHLSGTGIGDLCDISVMPAIDRLADTLPIKSHYSHQQETATPGYYAVRLQDQDIWAQMTASPRCGFHKYTFPASQNAMLRIDLGFAINWDRPTDCSFTKIDDSTFVGWRKSTGWAKEQWVYFAIRLSKPIKELSLFADNKPFVGNYVTAKKVVACLQFPTKSSERVMMKVGLSSASIEGAKLSLNEIKDWNFEYAKKQAENVWERELGKVQIHTANKQVMRTFYTALYHTFLAPIIFSDAKGEYKGTKAEVVKSKTGLIFSEESLWDTFRAANPLLTITQTELVPNIINSFMAFYDQNGSLPVWDLDFNETNTMTGYHSIPIIADAIMKNIRGFDWEMAYVAMRHSAMQDIRGTDGYKQFGYVPHDRHGQSVTITLEYAFDDWCLAQVAKKLRQYDDYELFMKRASGYQFLFDRKSGFFRARNSNGQWVEPFDPYYSDHGEGAMYAEGTAWQHTFFVPHDVRGYGKLMGGYDKLLLKLDSLFTVSSKMNGANVSNDISGMIGQYAHGNEPSHHIIYMFAALGQQWKTAEKAREIMATQYNTTPNGLSGNEDCGQMSAWYVWSAIGMYPMNPANGEYVFGSPLVDDVTIYLPANKVFKMMVKDNSIRNKYIQKVTWNGFEYKKAFIDHVDLMKGGAWEITMGAKPSKFGSLEEDWPTSMSK